MYSSSRNKAKVILLAVHTTEGILSASDLKAFFDRPTAEGSSHASADANGVLLEGAKDGFVDYALAAWTLRSGNPISDNIELCGFAKWKRPDWLARPKLLDACARWLAKRHLAQPWIPLVKLSPKEVAAGHAGVIGHADWTTGMNDGTHWDPGPDFPWDVVLDKARAYANQEDDMANSDEILRYVQSIDRKLVSSASGDRIMDLWNKIDDVEKRLISDPGDASDRLRDVWKELQAIKALLTGKSAS